MPTRVDDTVHVGPGPRTPQGVLTLPLDGHGCAPSLRVSPTEALLPVGRVSPWRVGVCLQDGGGGGCHRCLRTLSLHPWSAVAHGGGRASCPSRGHSLRATLTAAAGPPALCCP